MDKRESIIAIPLPQGEDACFAAIQGNHYVHVEMNLMVTGIEANACDGLHITGINIGSFKVTKLAERPSYDSVEGEY